MDHHTNPSVDLSRQAPTGPDQSRHVATPDDGDEYISLREALDVFVGHGRSVTERSLQRYCGKNHLACKKVITSEGEKWFALRSSVHNRIRELDEFDRLREQNSVATGRDMSRPVAQENTDDYPHNNERHAPTDSVSPVVESSQQSHTTSSDTPDVVATGRDWSRQHSRDGQHMTEQERALYDRLLATYEIQLDELRKDKGFLQTDKEALLAQLVSKDKQIDRFFMSERDTKTLFGSLQSLMSAIWPSAAKDVKGDRYAPVRDALESGLEREERGQ